MVYFYPRADTPGCATETCGFRDDWSAFEERDGVVVGISDDPVSDLMAFHERYDLPIELLSDESGTVSRAYGSYGEKTTFGRTFDGVLRNTHVVDPDGRIEHVFEDVSPDGHAGEILEAIA